ncbi:Uncharacterized protein AC501_3580 [Pseudomonas amygdali pv. lachrymans]|nr:Uncharacterized protein AC501_3580 [Pseudomonas amygdali pv. lachrymans]
MADFIPQNLLPEIGAVYLESKIKADQIADLEFRYRHCGFS